MTQSGGMFPDSEAGDAILYNRTTGEFLCIKYDELTANRYNYSSYTYRPIGVVAIPASHNVYGTGECGIISPLNMDRFNPDRGYVSSDDGEDTMPWGGSYLIDYPVGYYFPIISGSLTSNDIINAYYGGYLPTTYPEITKWKAKPGYGVDTISGYDVNRTSTWDEDATMIPSPYLENGGRNPSYYCSQGTYCGRSLEYNKLREFDGKKYTTELLKNVTYQANWKTDEYIQDTMVPTAACCCWRFHTEGTNQGDWYLPTVAEFGYVTARAEEIYNTLDILSSIFSYQYVREYEYMGYWTCSGSSSNPAKAENMYINVGATGPEAVTSMRAVRAFLRL